MTTGSAAVASGCPVAPGGYEAPPQPLGPDSLTWKYFGDWRGMLQGPWAGSMQNMHPQLGAAVEEYSSFRREPWPRVLRSLYPIGGVAFDGDRAPTTGAEVREYHTTIKGVDAKGRRYHALNPDVFYWAHSTFFVGTIHVAERFFGGITEDEKRQLFDEHITWYRMYGMSMRPVPETWEDFQAYWDHMCREVREDNRATRDVLDLAKYPKPPFANGFRLGCGPRYSDASSFRSWSGCVSGCTTHQCANYWAKPGRTATNGCTGDSAMRSGWCSMRCPSGRGSIRGPAPVGIVRRDGFPPMRRWCTLRRVTSRRSTSAAIPCITARRSEPRYRSSANGVHPAPSK